MRHNVESETFEHVAVFDDAVERGDYGSLAERFAEDAVMTFIGVPVGPFLGREQIRAAYEDQPPTDTMRLTSVEAAPAGHVIAQFAWAHGGTGTMTITWRDRLVAELTVSFER